MWNGFCVRNTTARIRPEASSADVRFSNFDLDGSVGMLARAGLTLARFALAAWVGAAALFVVTGVREVTTTDANLATSTVKDALVAVRFPAYYAFGFTLVGLAGFGLLAAYRGHGISRLRYFVCFGLVIAGFVLMIVDYFTIFLPLLKMVTPPGSAKPSEFTTLHEASKHINTLDVGLLLAAALLLCWPIAGKSPKPD
jgi:hypothetical protein